VLGTCEEVGDLVGRCRISRGSNARCQFALSDATSMRFVSLDGVVPMSTRIEEADLHTLSAPMRAMSVMLNILCHQYRSHVLARGKSTHPGE
jgi:hypothetical protein